jgi:1-acyl-sn-glycerol-3-phosphate acyltransferase
MQAVRGLWRLVRAVLHGTHGLLIVLLLFPRLPAAGRQRHIRWWSAKMLRMLGIELQVSGSFRPGAKLVVANHVSWLDIMAVHAICPEARFVSKADVQQWPLVGRLVASAGTLYIERERARDALRVVHQMAAAMGEGDTVAVFPEGTTGPGPVLLPFHANLMQAAIVGGTPVQPIALRYADANGPFSEAAQFLGDTTLAQSLWMLARAEGLRLHLTVLPAQGSRHADRRALTALLRGQIAETLVAEPGASPSAAASQPGSNGAQPAGEAAR